MKSLIHCALFTALLLPCGAFAEPVVIIQNPAPAYNPNRVSPYNGYAPKYGNTVRPYGQDQYGRATVGGYTTPPNTARIYDSRELERMDKEEMRAVGQKLTNPPEPPLTKKELEEILDKKLGKPTATAAKPTAAVAAKKKADTSAFGPVGGVGKVGGIGTVGGNKKK